MDQKDTNHFKYAVSVGVTGCGKSTLLNLLIGKTTKGLEGSLVCEDEYFKTSSNGNSETKEFKQSKPILLDDNLSIVFVDSPGLFDTDPIQRLTNYLNLHQFATTNKVIIMLTIDVSDINSNRGHSFLKLLESFHDIYRDLNSCISSVCLILTKFTPRYDEKQRIIEKMIRQIDDRYKDSENEEEKKKAKELQQFISQIKDVHAFTRPSDDCIDQIKEHVEEKQSIIKTIQKLTPLEPVNISVESLKLDQETQCLINISLPEQFREIKDPIDKLVIQYLTQFVIIENFHQQSFQQKLVELKKFDESTILCQMNYYQKILENLQNKSKVDDETKVKLMIKYKQLVLFSILMKDEFKKSTFIIKDLSKMYHQKINIDNNKIYFEGYFLQSSYLREVLNDQISEIVINVDYFIIDSDFECSGANLKIKCKQFIVDNNFEFNLSGKKGDKIENASTQDGQPGNPGYPGGDFHLLADEILTTKKNIQMIIDNSGGEGGDGQDGGNGKDGDNGQDGDIAGIASLQKKYLVKAVDITSKEKNYFSFNRQFEQYFLSQGTEGQKGQDAFKGGRYGLQGINGKVVIQNNKGQGVQTQIIKIKQVSRKGKNGQHGKPGKGGLSGRTAYAIYVDEVVFPTIRGVTKEMKKISGQYSENLYEAQMILQGAINTSLQLLSTSTAQLTGEVAVYVGATNLARVVAWPVGVGLTILQLGGSMISALDNSKFKTLPSLSLNQTRALDGSLPTTFNELNLKKPIKKIENVLC